MISVGSSQDFSTQLWLTCGSFVFPTKQKANIIDFWSKGTSLVIFQITNQVGSSS